MKTYFTLAELTYSDTAKKLKIKNVPNKEETENLERLIATVLNPLREAYGSAVKVNSGFRCEKLNKAVGGVPTSQHRLGEAADIVPVDGDTKRLFNIAKKLMEDGVIEVGQLIWEYGTKKAPAWVHISLPTEKHHNQVLYIGI